MPSINSDALIMIWLRFSPSSMIRAVSLVVAGAAAANPDEAKKAQAKLRIHNSHD